MGEGIAVSVMYFEEMHHISLKFLWIVNLLEKIPKFEYAAASTGIWVVALAEDTPGPAMFDFLVNRDLDEVAKRGVRGSGA
jgi:hypothetical protein